MDFSLTLISSSIASFLVYPIDVIKSQYQISGYQNKQTVTQLTKSILRQQGALGFYRGIGSHLMTYPLFWGTYFQIKDCNFKPTGYNLADKVITAIFSGGIASAVANPLFVIKVRKQTENLKGNSNIKYGSLINGIYKNEGARGFYKGLGPTIASNIKLGLQFPMYDYLKERSDSALVASLGSKILTSCVFYPLDLIRTAQRDAKEKLSAWHICKQTYSKFGLAGFYRGVGLYTLMTGPNFVLMMVIRDNLMRFV